MTSLNENQVENSFDVYCNIISDLDEIGRLDLKHKIHINEEYKKNFIFLNLTSEIQHDNIKYDIFIKGFYYDEDNPNYGELIVVWSILDQNKDYFSELVSVKTKARIFVQTVINDFINKMANLTKDIVKEDVTKQSNRRTKKSSNRRRKKQV